MIIKYLYRLIARPLFFLIEPEKMHDGMLKVGSFLGKHKISRKLTSLIFEYQNPLLEQTINGIKFKNPIGLSCGFDKNADLQEIIPNVGFGFTQIGTVTNDPSAGNAKPRLYRLKKSKALIVNYGLKNIGVDKILEKLKKNHPPKDFPYSISIGKSTCLDLCTTKSAVEDQIYCLKKIIKSNLPSFITINISCPNAVEGTKFTHPDQLEIFLKAVQKLKIQKPLYLKMPLNLPWIKFQKILDIAIKYNVSGVIIANLTKDRKQKHYQDQLPNIPGGISGKPTRELSDKLIYQTYKNYGDKLKIIGVGGIFSAEDAYLKIKNGASLLQIITGMIYVGPQLIGEINKKLVKKLKADGFRNLSEAIGSNHRK
jgi:dihydroorotate dehydrogenase